MTCRPPSLTKAVFSALVAPLVLGTALFAAEERDAAEKKADTKPVPVVPSSQPPVSGSAAPSASVSPQVGGVDMDALYEAGRTLFDDYAPEEVKGDYTFPTKEQWDSFLPRLEKALQGDSLNDLALLEQEARSGLAFIQTWQGAEELETWLKERIELIEAAKALAGKPSEALVQKGKEAGKPQPGEQGPVKSLIPAYDYWFARLQGSRPPANAAELMPVLARSFLFVNAPSELAWLAEVESSLNPAALSPAGAKGLFQLMPDTAKAYGLSIRLPDERLNPMKSARAAALLLRALYSKFGDWPLALAAYNAGEGRVRRLLDKHKEAKTFADIAEFLPVETRLYVPRVLATIATRTGITPDKLSAPKP